MSADSPKTPRPARPLADLIRAAQRGSDADPYAWIQDATRRHRAEHGCGAYTFSDGRQIQALAGEARPGRVLELGAALGYTACCWAAADASVDTIERDHTHVELARDNVRTAGLQDRVRVHHGDFSDVLPGLRGPYDAAFFDGFTPDEALLSAMIERLGHPALLVVTNLQMAGPQLSRWLTSLPNAETQLVDDDLALSAIA